MLPNPNGTAPGLHLIHDNRHIFCLPGPPSELYPMFEASVLPVLRQLSAGTPPLHQKVLRLIGLGESLVQEKAEAVLRSLGSIDIGYCARRGEVDLRLITRDPALLTRAAACARDIFGSAVYAEDDETMEQTVIRLATAQNLKIATAESCTGGLIAHRLTNIPGASAVFLQGWVTYSNASKTSLLDVDPALLERYGSVSPETASAMAQGALRHSGADLAVSVTGIAGPSGGSPEKPLGTVHFGLATRKTCTTHAKLLVPGREVFKTMASQFALDLLRRALMQF